MCVAAADRVQGPLGEDHGDDAVERDDRRVPRARERVVVEAEHLTITLNNGSAEVLEAAAEDDVEGARVLALRLGRGPRGNVGATAGRGAAWRSGWCPFDSLILDIFWGRRGSEAGSVFVVYLSEAKNLGLYVAAEARLFFRTNRALRRR